MVATAIPKHCAKCGATLHIVGGSWTEWRELDGEQRARYTLRCDSAACGLAVERVI